MYDGNWKEIRTPGVYILDTMTLERQGSLKEESPLLFWVQ